MIEAERMGCGRSHLRFWESRNQHWGWQPWRWAGLWGMVLALVVSGWLGQPAIAHAQPMGDADEVTSILSAQERKELEDLRTEKRLQQLIDGRISSSPRIQDRIEDEVDRAFSRTTTLLNLVLAILTIIPLLAALGVWLLRRSVVSELVNEVRSQVEAEVFAELKQRKLTAIAELEQFREKSLARVEQLVADAQSLLQEVVQKTEVANEEIRQLKTQTATQLETMVVDAQQIKDQTIQELTSLLPRSVTEELSPDVQPRLGNLTALLSSLKKAMPQITFTAMDSLKEGNAFFFESRYDDAIAAYDRAIQLNPELYEAWFTKASTLMLLQRYGEAATAYQFAAQLKPDSYDAWSGQGTALIKAQQYEAAIAALEQAIALRPEEALALLNRGIAYAELEQWEVALADYDAALAIKPDFARALFKKGQVLQKQADLVGAIAMYEAALNLNLKDASSGEVWYQKALCHGLQGDSPAAIAALEQAIGISPALQDSAKTDATLAPLMSSLKDSSQS